MIQMLMTLCECGMSPGCTEESASRLIFPPRGNEPKGGTRRRPPLVTGILSAAIKICGAFD